MKMEVKIITWLKVCSKWRCF